MTISIERTMKKINFFFCLYFSGIVLCFSQSSGPNSPNTYSTTGTGAGWSNLSGIIAVDNNPAYADLAQFPTCNSFLCYHSDIAHFTGFGFAIPSTATITGIKIDVSQRVSSPGGGIRDSLIMLSLNGNMLGADRSDTSYWLDTPTMNAYGDSLDTWGYSWTPGDVNDPTFGLQYQLTNDSYDQPASLDYLSMTVYYQTGTGIISQSSTPWEIRFIGSTLDIHGEAGFLASGAELEVRTTGGKSILKKTIDPGKNRLDLSLNAIEWPSGIYIVSITSTTGNTIQRKVILIK